MSDELNTGISIEFLLRQIDQALATKDIEAAEKLLADAKGRVQPGMPEHPNVQRQERDLQALRNARVASLEDAIRRLLTQTRVPAMIWRKKSINFSAWTKNISLDAWRNALAERLKQRA